MKEEILQEIGLSESEKKVYLALLDIGDSTRSKIVNSSGITGSKAYEILERLQEKGLTSIYMKDGVKHFKPLNPKQIMNYLDRKKEEILEKEKQAKSLIPLLLEKYNSSKEDQEVELISGLKGLEIIFREQVDLLRKGDICYVIGGTGGSGEDIVKTFFEKIHVLREKKKIQTKMLFNEKQKESTSELYSNKKYPGTKTRYIKHTSPVAINVYKNITVIIIFGNKINSIYIKSEDVARSFIEYFDLLWKNAKS